MPGQRCYSCADGSIDRLNGKGTFGFLLTGEVCPAGEQFKAVRHAWFVGMIFQPSVQGLLRGDDFRQGHGIKELVNQAFSRFIKSGHLFFNHLELVPSGLKRCCYHP